MNTLTDLEKEMLIALEASEYASNAARSGDLPLANDPGYTPYIGEWNGKDEPGERWREFTAKRRELRRAAIRKAKGEA